MKLKVFFYSIFINGYKYKVYTKQHSTLLNFIKFLQYQNGKNLSILEYNGQIINFINEKKVSYFIKNNDQIEVITIVGGG